MGSLQNLARGGGRSSGGGGAPGLGLGGLAQGRLTPTQFGGMTGSRTMGGLGQSMSLLQSASSNSRNPLFSRKMGDGSLGSGPNTFDPSEFPSLGQGSGGGGLAGRPNYVGMVKQPTEHGGSEFLMSSEDFPALPGAPGNSFVFSDPSGHMLDSVKMNNTQLTPEQELAKSAQARKGIQTSPDGLVTNIPTNMVVDQFGMIGLLTFIRAAETDPNLVSLALGADLTTTAIREKLAPVKLNRYKDDILFYMFYTNVGDVLQMAAAAELYNRDWRYHKEERVWITRAPGMAPSEKTTSYERGTYYFFDVNSWRKVPKEFHLDYDKLEERPSLPSSLQAGPSPGVAGVGGPHPNHPGPLSGSPGPMGGPAQGGPGGLQAVGPPNSGL